MTIEVTKEFRFEAAHRLMNHEGPCKNIHGHSYKLVVTVTGEKLNEDGMVVDFGVLSEAVKDILERGSFRGGFAIPLDHALLLYEEDPLATLLSSSEATPERILELTQHPTAEYLADLLAGMIGLQLDYFRKIGKVAGLIFVTRVEVWETAKARATWTAEGA